MAVLRKPSLVSVRCRYKLFNLSKAYNKGLSQTDVQMMATSVLLAALSILPYEHKDKDRSEADSELEKERSVRMATILGFSVDTKRNARYALAAPHCCIDFGLFLVWGLHNLQLDVPFGEKWCYLSCPVVTCCQSASRAVLYPLIVGIHKAESSFTMPNRYCIEDS